MPLRTLLASATLSPTAAGWIDYTKTLLVLAGICILALLAVKWWLPKLRNIDVSQSKSIRVLARYPLEARKTLYVVRAGKTMVLLASSADAVHFMTALDPADFEEPLAAGAQSASAFGRIAKAMTDRQPGDTK